MLFQPSFRVSLNALPGVLHGKGARSVPQNLTRHRLEGILTKFVDTHVCIRQAQECCVPSMYCVCHPCVVLGPRCTHNSRGTLGSHFAQNLTKRQVDLVRPNVLEKFSSCDTSVNMSLFTVTTWKAKRDDVKARFVPLKRQSRKFLS